MSAVASKVARVASHSYITPYGKNEFLESLLTPLSFIPIGGNVETRATRATPATPATRHSPRCAALAR